LWPFLGGETLLSVPLMEGILERERKTKNKVNCEEEKQLLAIDHSKFFSCMIIICSKLYLAEPFILIPPLAPLLK